MEVESPSVTPKASPKAAKPKPEDYTVQEADLPQIVADWKPTGYYLSFRFLHNIDLFLP